LRFLPWRRHRAAEAVAATGVPSTAEAERQASRAALERVEFRSFVRLPAGDRFSLHDPDGAGWFWIGAGETMPGFEAIAFDAENHSLKLRHGEFTREVPLGAARVRELDDTAARMEELRARVNAWENKRMGDKRFEAALRAWPGFGLLRGCMNELIGEVEFLRTARAKDGSDPRVEERLQATERRLAADYQKMRTWGMEMIATQPGLNAEDREMFSPIVDLIPYFYPELGERK
jgi:hypothetical protein